MRIVQINTVYKYGGSTGRIVYDLKMLMENKGIESFVAFGYEYEKTNDPNTLKLATIFETKISILETRIDGRHAFYNRVQTKKLLMWLDEIQPDLIHLHNLHNHYINVEMLFQYIKGKKIPIVWTLHDCWPFTGWCAHFDYIGCEKWKIHCNDCPNIKEYPFTWFFDRSSENFDRKKTCFQNVKNLTIVTPSEWLSRLVRASFLKEYDVQVINNGVDLDVFYPRRSEIKGEIGVGDRKMILAMAMGLSKLKGIDYITQMAERFDTTTVAIVIVGVEPRDIPRLPNTVIGLERTSDVNKLAELYSAADVFINPTLQDTFPTTNLEALACGTPVVTFRTGGSTESIFEGSGYIAEKGNLNDLCKKTEVALLNGKNAMRCRRIAEEKYDKTTCFQKYIDLYKNMIDLLKGCN